ncbi:MAG: hypothetical protein K6L75_03080 [Cellvibrionaceae bacterium]
MQRSFLRSSQSIIGTTLLSMTAILAFSVNADKPKVYNDYKVPLNIHGQPDLSGFWSNASLTPLTRPRDLGNKATYTEEEVAKAENLLKLQEAEANQATDPDAPAEYVAESKYEVKAQYQAAGGDVGGYNYFWLDPGSRVMRVGGEPRTSILTTKNGQFPSRKKDAPPFRRFYSGSGAGPGAVDYALRSLGERCIIGFGRNGGPPMFANGFYNNNYQIVQAPDHVMILVEMNHDARIIRLNSKHRTDDVRPWFGDSIGHWDGNTLVVETTHIHPRQALYGAWENLTVTERFTRVSKERLHYSFTIDDPTVWDKKWGGEYEFSPLDGVIYEYGCHEGNYALPGILKGLLMEKKKK